MAENKYTLSFYGDTEETISGLVAKYHLELNWDKDISEIIKEPDPEIVIFELAKKILNKEGSFKDISDALKKELNMSQKDAESLAHDIKNNVVSLAEIDEPEEEATEEQGEELKDKTDEQAKKESFERAKEELMAKIGAKQVAQETIPKKQEVNVPGAVKPIITDVENNAENIQHTQERDPEATPVIEKPQPTASDPYKESIE